MPNVRLFLAAFLLFAPPAFADDRDVRTQYGEARHIFAGGAAGEGSFMEYYRNVLDGLDGRWVAASHLLLEGNEAEGSSTDFIDTACTDDALSYRIKVDLYGFEMVAGAGTVHPVRSRYVARGGASFSVATEPTEIVANLGLDDATDGSGAVRSAIRRGNGSVALFRPSSDILVAVGGGGLSMAFYARCP